MGQLEETNLPGIGQRVEFFNEEGRRLGVVRHHSGRREVFVCQPGDPDTSQVAVTLTEADAHNLVAALGVATRTEDEGPRTYDIEGLLFEWIDIADDAPVVGRSIGELRIRTTTGASVVAVIRHPDPVPAPEPDFTFATGDTVVVAGTSAGVESVRRLLQPDA